MKPMRLNRHRSRRGFSLLEVLVASAIFLFGVTGVTVLVSNASLVTRKGVMNTQVTQFARDRLREMVTGAVYPLTPPTTAITGAYVSGVRVTLDTEVFDTGGPAGMELAAQLPGCKNLEYPSQCVRVTATDSDVPCMANADCTSNRCVKNICVGPSGQYQVEAYVIAP